MRYINNLSEELEVFKALGSEVRISILTLLLERGKMSMNELAEQLDITNGAMTNHIRKLESADLIRVTSDPNVHGNLKLCEPHLDKILFILNRGIQYNNDIVLSARRTVLLLRGLPDLRDLHHLLCDRRSR